MGKALFVAALALILETGLSAQQTFGKDWGAKICESAVHTAMNASELHSTRIGTLEADSQILPTCHSSFGMGELEYLRAQLAIETEMKQRLRLFLFRGNGTEYEQFEKEDAVGRKE